MKKETPIIDKHCEGVKASALTSAFVLLLAFAGNAFGGAQEAIVTVVLYAAIMLIWCAGFISITHVIGKEVAEDRTVEIGFAATAVVATLLISTVVFPTVGFVLPVGIILWATCFVVSRLFLRGAKITERERLAVLRAILIMGISLSAVLIIIGTRTSCVG